MNTAAILVGGRGTRLQSLVSDVPKPLAMVAGEPFLFILLRSLRASGVTQVVLLTGFMHEKIVEACGNGEQFGLEIFYSQEQKALGTAGALKNAEAILAGCEEFLLLNGDTYLDSSLDDIIHYPLKKDMMGVIGVTEPDDARRYGSILLEEHSNKIKSFREKDEKATCGLVSAGIYKISSKILEFIPCNQFCSLETDLFPLLLANHYHLHALRLSGDFCDIGIPDSYTHFNYSQTIESEKLHPIAKMLLHVILQKSVVVVSSHPQCDEIKKFLEESSAWNHFSATLTSDLTKSFKSIDLLVVFEGEASLQSVNVSTVLRIKPDTVEFFQKQLFIEVPRTGLNLIFDQVRSAWKNLQISFAYFDSVKQSTLRANEFAVTE